LPHAEPHISYATCLSENEEIDTEPTENSK